MCVFVCGLYSWHNSLYVCCFGQSILVCVCVCVCVCVHVHMCMCGVLAGMCVCVCVSGGFSIEEREEDPP